MSHKILIALIIGLSLFTMAEAKTNTIKFVQITGTKDTLYGLTKEGSVYFYTTKRVCESGQGMGGGGNVPCKEIPLWMPCEMITEQTEVVATVVSTVKGVGGSASTK